MTFLHKRMNANNMKHWIWLTALGGVVVLGGFSGPFINAQAPAVGSAKEQAPVAPDSAWPQWLGPRRDGISRSAKWSVDWPKDGLAIDWKQNVGIGFSSCSLIGDRLYTMGNVDGDEHVWCLDAATGKVIWRHAYPCELVDNLYEGGPGATPTLEGDRLYTIGKEGQFLCLNRHTGKVVWERSLQKEFDVELPEWGFNASPLIVGNNVLVQGGRVAAFAKNSGEKVWQTEKHQAGYGSATVFTSQGQQLVATLDCDGLRIVRLEDGQELAFVEWPSPFRTNSTTPIVKDDLIYISSGYNVGCGLFRWRDGELEEVYTSRKMRNHFNNSILLRGHLYGFDGNSNLGRIVRLTCMDFKTGEVAWQQRGFGCGSLIVANDMLMVLSESGDLVVAKASPAGFEEIARSPLLEGRCWTTPVVVNRRVYARNAAGELVCATLPKPKD